VPPLRATASREVPAEPLRTTETGSIAKPEPQKAVATAQRALTKLGFGPLKSDGVMGSGTRQAIERYERSRGLPVTGELGARTMRDLLAQAGSGAD
jgi:peptidoglycan hydrolase-like protein with peptidoglycan-binding domain